MKKLLLFLFLTGMSLFSASCWAAAESECPIRQIRIKPSQNRDYDYCCMREKWFFTEVDSGAVDHDTQEAIYEGYSGKYENLVSRWRLRKAWHNRPDWMVRIS